MRVKGGTKRRKNIERKSIAACLALMLMVALLGGAGSVEMVSAEEANAVNIARYAVVRIFGVGPDGTTSWVGTGFGVAGDGKYADTFVTNWHVTTESGEYDYDDCKIYILLDDETYWEYDSNWNYVGFHLGSAVECEVLYAENEYPDVAIIQTAEPVSGVEILPLRKVTQDIVGQNVYAIGYPGSADTYEGTTKEIWASVESVTVTTGVVSRCTVFTYADDKYHIFTDAHINNGNSGGPLVLSDGSVVGINTYGYGETDDGEYTVSVYIDYAMEALDNLGIEYTLADDSVEESSDDQASEAEDSEAGSGDSQDSEAGDSESSASSGDSENSSASGDGDSNSSGESDDGDSFIYFVIAACVIVVAVVIVVIVINARKKKSAGGSSSGSAGASAASGAGGNSPAGAAGSSSDAAGGSFAAGGSSGAAGSAAGDNGFRLQGTAGAFAGRRFRIEGETFIGRDPARCKIVYPNKTAGVSSVHCSVRVQNGTAMIMDMGSTYGTFVNGRRLDPNRAYSLSIGDKISLGTPQESFQVTRQGGVV